MKRILFGVILATALSFQAFPALSGSVQSSIAAYDAEDCAPVVEDKISSLSIHQDQIKRINYITIQYNPSDDAEVYEYESWISFASCPGNLVINMDNACFVNKMYAKGGCTKNGAIMK